MKKLLALFLAAALSSAAFAADAVPQFNATLSLGKEHRFVLVSSVGKASSFLRLNESFDGYLLKAYDAKTGELTLEKDGKATKVTLQADAAITNATGTTNTPATVASASAMLDAMHFEEMMDKILAGVRKQQTGAMGQAMGRMLPPGVDEETKAAVLEMQKKVVDEMMGGMTGAGLKGDVAKIYAETFTQEEITQMGNFFQTPLGKMMNDKQPVVSEKMNAIMTERMMSTMPKVQQMMQGFGREMAQRRAAAAAGAASAPAPTPAPAPAPKN
jgi:hypothetical protein